MLFQTVYGAAAYVRSLQTGHQFKIELDASICCEEQAMRLFKQLADITGKAVSFNSGCADCEEHAKTPRHHLFTGRT